MNLYISGPISNGEKLPKGHPDRQRNEEAFFTAELALHENGHTTVNPMRLHVAHPTWNWQQKLRVDIAALVLTDGIVMLPGWNGSEGACLEREVASRLGLKIFYGVANVE